MSLNPMYIVAPSIQQYFVDKSTGLPLSGGKVYTYSDINRTIPKTTYTIAGSANNYSYTPLPNPIILSGVGTVMDNNYNDVQIYWYPFDDEGNQELYYVVVTDSLGNPQETREAWPNPTSGGSNDLLINELTNFIPNGQFLAHTNIADGGALVGGSNPFAYGGLSVELPVDPMSTNTLTFVAQQTNDVTPQSPRYLPTFTCSAASALDDFKIIRVKFSDVNKFSDADSQTYTFAFWAQSNVSVPVDIAVYKYFGTSGSTATSTVQSSLVVSATPTLFNVSIDFGDNTGKTIDLTAENDFVAIDIQLPLAITFEMQFTDFVLLAGDIAIPSFPVQTNADMLTRGVFGDVDIPDPNGGNLGQSPFLTPTGMSWGTSSASYHATLFTTTGTFTSAANSSTSTIYRIRGCGGGGGGGGANGVVAAAGGGGSSVSFELTMSGIAANTAIAVTIGAAGTGGTSGATGGTGGSTVLATPISLTSSGGLGGVGTSSAGAAGGVGGALTATGTYLTIFSSGGQTGMSGFGVSNNLSIGGNGADCSLGQGGPGGAPNYSLTGAAATGYGAGGGGAINTTSAGGAGAPGIVIIERMTQ